MDTVDDALQLFLFSLQFTAFYGVCCLLSTILVKMRAGRSDSGTSRLKVLLMTRANEALDRRARREVQDPTELEVVMNVVKHVGDILQVVQQMLDRSEGSFFRRMWYAARINASLEEAEDHFFVILNSRMIIMESRMTRNAAEEPAQSSSTMSTGEVGSASEFPQPANVSCNPPPHLFSHVTPEQSDSQMGADSGLQPHTVVQITPEQSDFRQRGADCDLQPDTVIEITPQQSSITVTNQPTGEPSILPDQSCCETNLNFSDNGIQS